MPANSPAFSQIGFQALVTDQGPLPSPFHSPCDVNGDGTTNISDLQLAVNQALGPTTCTADINKDGVCNALDVQLVVNAVLTGSCAGP